MIFKSIVVCILLLVNQIHCEVSDIVLRNDQKLGQEENTKSSDKLYDEFKVNVSNITAVREGEIALREMCIKNGGNDSFENAMLAVKRTYNCFTDIISFAELPSKINKAKPIGELDTVFKDYCHRSDDLKGCVYKFLGEVEPCLAEGQKSSKYTLQNITEAILKFVCENEGDHIALFISEKGPECILSKQSGIETCIKTRINDTKANETYEDWLNATNSINLNNVGNVTEQQFSFLFELEQCKNMYGIRKCIIHELQNCTGSTPANVVESIFNLIQNSTSCRNFKREELDPGYNSGVSIYQSMFSIIIPALTVLFVRNFSNS